MRTMYRVGFILVLSLGHGAAGADLPPKHGLDEVSHQQVELRGGLLGARV